MNYSFLTSESFRIDATARNPKQAYKLAKIKLSVINKHNKEHNRIDFGELTGTYFKYDKDGLHDVYGAYYQI